MKSATSRLPLERRRPSPRLRYVSTATMADWLPPQQGVLKKQEAQSGRRSAAHDGPAAAAPLAVRADYLNQLNTQAALVGAAIGLLVRRIPSSTRFRRSASAMMSTATPTRLTDTGESCVFSDFEGEWADRINHYLYMASTCGCIASSIWVLYTSTNLVQFGTLAALMPGENNQGTEVMRRTDLIHHRMADVQMFVFSLVCPVGDDDGVGALRGRRVQLLDRLPHLPRLATTRGRPTARPWRTTTLLGLQVLRRAILRRLVGRS